MTKPKRNERPARTKKERRLRVALISVGAVLVVLVGGAGFYAASLSQKFNSAEKIFDAFPDETDRPAEVVVPPDEPAAQNILLLGSDTRGKISGSLDSAGGNRSDTMMVVHIPADRENIQVMSMMRDSWVQIPGRGEAKINAALSYGGVPLAIQTVESLIGTRIDHVAIVDFVGFSGITDALGGITIDNPIAFTSRGNRFEQGQIPLNGAAALAFVRERYTFSDGDFQRVRNQQLFIKAVMGKTLSRETLTNPVKIGDLVGAITPYLAVDEGLDSGYAAGLGFELGDIRSDDVTFFTMPTLGTGNVGGQSIVRVDFDTLEIIKEHFTTDTLDEFVPEVQTIG